MRQFLMPGLLAVMCSGCIYQHTFEPLTTNFDRTPSGVGGVTNNTKHITFNYVNVYWGSNGIGSIAKQHGLEEIYYADLERLRILGVWTQEWVHVYGR